MKNPGSKPHIIVNMAMSADGKISTRKRERMTFGSKNDRNLMDRLRSRADAVIIGAGTVSVDGFPLVVRNAAIRKERNKKKRSPHPANVILSRTLDIPARRPIFLHENIDRILFTTREATRERRKRFEKCCEVIVLPARNYLHGVLNDLHARGMERILLEGGGALNFAFFKEALVDELYLTVTPRIIGGGGAPTVADGAGFRKDTQVNLELVSAKRIGQEVFLHYRVR